jgi:hypothetical protein
VKTSEVKYQLEYYPNQDMCGIHLNKKILQNRRMGFDTEFDADNIAEELSGEKLAREIVELMENVDGIENLCIEKYSITLSKGKAFDWSEIITQALNILNCCLGTKKEMKEKSSPIVHPKLSDEDAFKLNRMDMDDEFY